MQKIFDEIESPNFNVYKRNTKFLKSNSTLALAPHLLPARLLPWGTKYHFPKCRPMMTLFHRPLLEDISCVADLGHVRLLLHSLLVRETNSLITMTMMTMIRDAKSCRCCRYICAIFFSWVVNGGWAVAHPPILRLPKRSDKVTNDKKIKFITLTYY